MVEGLEVSNGSLYFVQSNSVLGKQKTVVVVVGRGSSRSPGQWW